MPGVLSLRTTTTRNPTTPRGLGSAGSKLWRQVCDRYELDAHELLLLVEVAHGADRLEELRAAVAADGAVLRDDKGGPRIHPAHNEWRMTALALSKLLATLNLPADDATLPGVRSGRSRAASKAAKSRWREVNSGSPVA